MQSNASCEWFKILARSHKDYSAHEICFICPKGSKGSSAISAISAINAIEDFHAAYELSTLRSP